MCAVKKNPLLNLPVKLILTTNGVSYFISHGKKLLRIKLANNQEQYGIALVNFTPQSIQRMILLDYISNIEVSMTDFSSHGDELIDLSKVIVYSLLYKQFDRQVAAAIVETECIRKYNRSHPTHLLDGKTLKDESVLRTFFSDKQESINLARKKLLEPLWKRILSDDSLSSDEKNIQTFLSEKFLNRLNLMNWYIILKFYNSEGAEEILSIVQHILDVYMEKSKVADYIAMLVVELARNSENMNLIKLAHSKFPSRTDIPSIITDTEIRAKLLQELKEKHHLVYLTWMLGGGSVSIGKQGRLQISLHTNDDSVDSSRIDATRLNGRTFSLIDYYYELSSAQKNTDLGFYYLTYLDEMCKKLNIKLESIVNRSSLEDLTIMNLILNF